MECILLSCLNLDCKLVFCSGLKHMTPASNRKESRLELFVFLGICSVLLILFYKIEEVSNVCVVSCPF